MTQKHKESSEKAKLAAELDIANKELLFQNEEKEKLAAKLLFKESALKERTKEITLLYEFSNLVENIGDSLTDLFKSIIEIIPAAWQYPEITCVRLVIGDTEYTSPNWRETPWKQSSDIYVHGKLAGTIEVRYLEQRPEDYEGSFLINERYLIDEVVERLGKVITRFQTEEALKLSEEKFRLMFESAKDGILILDAETGKINDVNLYLIELLGYSKEEFIQKEIWDIGALKDIIPNKGNLLELQEQEYTRYEDIPIHTSGGKRIEVEFAINVYSINDKSIIQCSIRDITERKKSEEIINQLASFPSLNPNPIIELKLDGTLKYLNSAAKNLFPDLESLGTRHPFLANWQTSVTQLSAQESDTIVREIMVGGCYYLQSIQHVKSLNVFRIYSHNITERKRSEETITQVNKKLEKARSFYKLQSETDETTNLFNQRRFFVEVSNAYDKAFNYQRREENFCVAFIDVDHFKKVNDAHGHPFGDYVLKEIAAIITNAIRTYDIAFRYGGDEFLILFKGITKEEAKVITNRIRKKIETTTFSKGDNTFNTTISAGIASAIEKPNAESLINLADKRLYNAKAAGRNTIL